jgi:signal transduction histidine kinase
MSLIPILVFFYLLITKFFSIDIVIGDTGLVIAIVLFLAFLGYLSGFSTVRGLLNKVIMYTEEAKTAYDKLSETQQYLIQAEKFQAVGQLASGIAHEVKNPLSIITQGIEYLESRFSAEEEDMTSTMDLIKNGVKRADNIISDILDFSKASTLRLQPEDVNIILKSALKLVKNRFKFEHVQIIEVMTDDLPYVFVDKNKIEQVFINILLNAAQAMPEGGGKIIVRSYTKILDQPRNGIGERKDDHFRPGERAVIVEIEDTGTGIPERNLIKVFDPFYTTKGPRGGSGLGLFVSRNILNMHRGLIYAESKIGEGTKITIILKKAAEESWIERR